MNLDGWKIFDLDHAAAAGMGDNIQKRAFVLCCRHIADSAEPRPRKLSRTLPREPD